LKIVMDKSFNVLWSGRILNIRLDVGFNVFTREICTEDSRDYGNVSSW
jgi:hypothetical protein